MSFVGAHVELKGSLDQSMKHQAFLTDAKFRSDSTPLLIQEGS